MSEIVENPNKGRPKYRSVTLASTKERKWEIFCHNYRVANYNVEKACDATGITYSTFTRWRREQPGFNTLIAQTEAFLRDKAFAKTAELIDDGDGATIRHFQNAQDPRFKKVIKHDVSGRVDHVHGRILEGMTPEEKREELRALLGDDAVSLLDKKQPVIDVTEAEEAEVIDIERSGRPPSGSVG